MKSKSKKIKEDHLSQWIEGSKKTEKQRHSFRQIVRGAPKAFNNFKKDYLFQWMAALKKRMRKHPRWWIAGISVLTLAIIAVSIVIGINIGKKGGVLKMPSLEQLKEESGEIIGKVEKDLSQQLQGIVNKEFGKTDYRYAVYVKILETKSGEELKTRLEVYPVTASSWDKLFSREREEIVEKFIKIYKEYINKKEGEIHIRNNVKILATASWAKGEELKVEIEL